MDGSRTYAVDIGSENAAISSEHAQSQPLYAAALLDLPSEILDLILSYALTIPSHPSCAMLPRAAINDLFLAQALHVNQALRSRTLSLISQNCPWIKLRIRCSDSMMDVFRPRWLALPLLPTCFESLVSENVPSIDIDIEFGTEGETVTRMLPYNFYSLIALVATSCEQPEKLSKLSILTDQLPDQFRLTLASIIAPVARFLDSFRQLIKKAIATGMDTGLQYVSLLTESYIRAVVSLDEAGRRLEATILCIFTKSFTEQRPLHERLDDPYYDLVGSWICRTENGLKSVNWRNEPYNLGRMRTIRTLCYIETRACRGVLEALKIHGSAFCHVDSLLNRSQGLWMCYSERFMLSWLGIPDHELAEWFYAKSCILQYHLVDDRSDVLNVPIFEDDYLRSDFEYPALEASLLAWVLDRDNIQYQANLYRHLSARDGGPATEELYRMALDISNSVITITDASDGRSGVIIAESQAQWNPRTVAMWKKWAETHWEGHGLDIYERAKQLGDLVTVAYDARRRTNAPPSVHAYMRPLRKLIVMNDKQPNGFTSWQTPEFDFVGAGLHPERLHAIEHERYTLAPWTQAS